MEEVLPGFRFFPTEEELVSFYLYHKLRGSRMEEISRVIPPLHIYDFNPWDLPQVGGDMESEQWFFFNERQRREGRGGRANRLTTEGYWKATGSPGNVYSSQHCVIGRKRTMVFYVGRAPNGIKTSWKMNEYKAVVDSLPSSSSTPPLPNPQLREEVSLCRIYKKSRSIRGFDRRPPSDDMAVESSSSRTDVVINNNPNQLTGNENINQDIESCWDYDQFNNL